jgi:hypothetical protein
MEIPTMQTYNRRLLYRVFLVLVPFCLAAKWVASDSTVYAPSYSAARFRSVRIGMSREEVIRLLGQPLSVQPAPGYILWVYAPSDGNPRPRGNGPTNPSPETAFQADSAGKILSVAGSYLDISNDDLLGHQLAEVRERFGEPLSVYSAPERELYWYSKIDGVKGHYVRYVDISSLGTVSEITAGRVGYYPGAEGERPSNWLEWLEWHL